MYIEPNSKIYILKNCPLDLSLDHTLYFSSKDKQREYFESLAKHKLSAQTYSRPSQGVLKVEIPADQLYDCNYIMFQNTSFGSKWFYAYIKSVEYVSNNVSRINFVIDVMQTWHFDYELEECFIVREHTKTDYIGEHLVDEGLELGEFVEEDAYQWWDEWREQTVNVVTTFENEVGDATEASGGFYSGIYSGLFIRSYDANSIVEMNKLYGFLLSVTAGGHSDGVVSIFMCPKFMVQERHGAIAQLLNMPTSKERTFIKPYSTINGYSPKNKKLFTAPYKYLLVTTDTGDSHQYLYEYFKTDINGNNSFLNDKMNFIEYYVYSPQPECTLVPNNYRGARSLRDERLNLSDFPVCAFTIDSYLAWWAQRRTAIPYEVQAQALNFGRNLVNWATSGGSSIGAANLISNTAFDTADYINNQMMQNGMAKLMPPSCNGNISGGGLTTAIKQKGYLYRFMCITANYAKRIDDYFTVFGYKVNRLGVPNRANRPHWTFIKTANCCIKGSVPCDDAKTICDTFNRGITFWRNGNEVGNYSLNNSP